MKSTTTFLASCSLALTAFSVPAFCQDLPGHGWSLTGAPSTLGSARAYLDDDTFVEFDGLDISHFDATGGLIQVLDSLPAFVFPSFVEVLPGGVIALVGESSNGDILEVDLVNGGSTLLTNLVFNYDLELDMTAGFAYVSTAQGGFGTGNDIVRLDLTAGTSTVVAHVNGPSGALSVSDAGDVFYVTQFDGWPIPPGSSSILKWDDAELDFGILLDESDADIVVPSLNGGSSMRFDQVTNSLFVANSDFSGGLTALSKYDAASGAWLEDVLTTSNTINGIQLFHGTTGAVLAAFQPASSYLRVNQTDWNLGTATAFVLDPQRPTITFSGPPAGLSGPATVTITGAMPSAGVRLTVSDPADLLASEGVFDFGVGVPYFLSVDPVDIWRRTSPLATDANGTMVLTYNQPAGLAGNLVFQGLLEGPLGEALGTSDWVINN